MHVIAAVKMYEWWWKSLLGTRDGIYLLDNDMLVYFICDLSTNEMSSLSRKLENIVHHYANFIVYLIENRQIQVLCYCYLLVKRIDVNLIKIRSLIAPDYVAHSFMHDITKPGAIKDRILITM